MRTAAIRVVVPVPSAPSHLHARANKYHATATGTHKLHRSRFHICCNHVPLSHPWHARLQKSHNARSDNTCDLCNCALTSPDHTPPSVALTTPRAPHSRKSGSCNTSLAAAARHALLPRTVVPSIRYSSHAHMEVHRLQHNIAARNMPNTSFDLHAC